LLRTQASLAEEIIFHPRMAHPSPARLWASARRGADRDVCACPAATGCRVGAARDPKPRSAGKYAIRGVLSLVSFFARAKKETRPRCGEPQLAFEIARQARDTM